MEMPDCRIDWDQVNARIDALTDDEVTRIASELSAEINATDSTCRSLNAMKQFTPEMMQERFTI
jgi:hypothetical protein